MELLFSLDHATYSPVYAAEPNGTHHHMMVCMISCNVPWYRKVHGTFGVFTILESNHAYSHFFLQDNGPVNGLSSSVFLPDKFILLENDSFLSFSSGSHQQHKAGTQVMEF